MAEEIDLKDFMTKLYVEQKEGTETLYTDIGYVMRMKLFDRINTQQWIELSEDCKQNIPGSEGTAREYFNDIVSSINAEVMSMNDPDLKGPMLYDRNLIQKMYSTNPVKFVHAMAENFEQESRLISRYKINNRPQDNAKEEVIYTDSNEIFLESEQCLEEFHHRLHEVSQRSSTNTDFGIGSSVHPNIGAPQAALDSLHRLVESLKVCEKKVGELIDKAMRADAMRSVSLTPHTNVSYEELSSVCNRFTSIINELYTQMHHPDYKLRLLGKKHSEVEQSLNEIITYFFQRNMIFIKHPKDVILVTNSSDKKGETEMKTENGASPVSSKGKKGSKAIPKDKSRVYSTKKKESIDGKVCILGLTKIKSYEIRSHSLIMATEQQLSSMADPQGAQEPCAEIHHLPNNLPSGGEIEFKNLKIGGYERASDSVYEQLVRLQYRVELSVFGQKFSLQAFSLPFFLCTGAIQVLELFGSRLWYLANKMDLFHGDFRVIPSLNVEEVINMLENRLKSTCSRRQRGFSYNGREFMKERIPEIDSHGHVTLHTFVKDKMKIDPNDRSTDRIEYYKYTFFAWFYAFIRTIEKDFKDLWHDGIIYELFSYRDSQEFLLGETISSGCVILRPGLSKIFTPNSPDAYIRFTMDMKVRDKGEWKVRSIPLDPARLETSSIYDVVYNNVVYKVKPKCIYTRNGIKPLDILKKYCNHGSNKTFMYRGGVIQEKFTSVISSDEAEDAQTQEEDCDESPRKRKEPRQDSSPSFPEPVEGASMFVDSYDSRRTDSVSSANTDIFSPVSSTQEQRQSPSNHSAAVSPEQDASGAIWQCGSIKVDVSNIPIQLPTAQMPTQPLCNQQVAYEDVLEVEAYSSFTSQLMESDLHPQIHPNFNNFLHEPSNSDVNQSYNYNNFSIPTTVHDISRTEGNKEGISQWTNQPQMLTLQELQRIGSIQLPPQNGLCMPMGWTQHDLMDAINP